MKVRDFVNAYKESIERGIDWIRENVTMESGRPMRPEDDSYTKGIWDFAKHMSPIFLGITSDYVLDNYQMEFYHNTIMFRWITPVTPKDMTPRSTFTVDLEDDGSYSVSIGRKQWETALATRSIIAVVAFLNVYEDYLIEQKLFAYEY